MLNTKKKKTGLFALSLAALILCGCLFAALEHSLEDSRRPIIQSARPMTTGYRQHDYSHLLLFRGQPVPIDTGTSTIYITQDPAEPVCPDQIFKDLYLKTGGYQMYLITGQEHTSAEDCRRSKHTYQLMILDRLKRYMQYDVVLTTFPVVSLNGQYSATAPETQRDIYSGDFMLWSPVSENGNPPDILYSKASWHLRGGYSSQQPKTPWRLSLLKSNGSPRHMDLMGLGADDDWILNPMNMENTKIREKLFMDLWNQEAKNSGQLPMSSGQYIEVLENDSYMGLYLLQRRVDSKFLDVNPQDALFKGIQLTADGVTDYLYEQLCGPESSRPVLDQILAGALPQALDPENLIDVNLFLQFANARDNIDPKNMYYLLHSPHDHPRLQLVPWDTDMSFGVVFAGGFLYDFNSWQDLPLQRPETEFLQRPDLREKTAVRWSELRQGVLSDSSVSMQLEFLWDQVNAGGAYERDQSLWGSLYYGEDTIENLRQWVRNRLQYLDAYYGVPQS